MHTVLYYLVTHHTMHYLALHYTIDNVYQSNESSALLYNTFRNPLPNPLFSNAFRNALLGYLFFLIFLVKKRNNNQGGNNALYKLCVISFWKGTDRQVFTVSHYPGTSIWS